MSTLGNPSDDLPHVPPTVSPGAERDANGANDQVREFALGIERDQADHRFEAIARAVDAALLRSADAYARRRVGAHDAPEAISRTWEKVLAKFDPPRGPFKSFFFTVLHNACMDVIRERKHEPEPSEDVTMGSDRTPGASVQDALAAQADRDEIVRQWDHLEGLIAEAIEVLNLTPKHRAALRNLLDDGATGPPGDRRTAAAERQQRKRMRDWVTNRAGLTAEERAASALVRSHPSLAAAVAAAPGVDVAGLSAAADRKVLALFGIETEDDLK
jgi:DNA-directed RNA polymerase specialized sigma24 family protein